MSCWAHGEQTTVFTFIFTVLVVVYYQLCLLMDTRGEESGVAVETRGEYQRLAQAPDRRLQLTVKEVIQYCSSQNIAFNGRVTISNYSSVY
jgi:hypothetical protein